MTENHEYLPERLGSSKIASLCDLIAKQLDVRGDRRPDLKNSWLGSGAFICDMDFFLGSGTQEEVELVEVTTGGREPFKVL